MKLHCHLLAILCCIGMATLQPSCVEGSAIHGHKLDEHQNTTLAPAMQAKGRRLLPSYSQSAIISRYITVDQHGDGQYTTVQGAVDSVPEKNRQWVYIQINAGLYKEKVTIPYTKPYIIFQGAGRKNTVISWSDRASSSGTADSATFSANAASFVARGIGFSNASPSPAPGASGGQAVAVLLGGDMMAFYECGFYGAQDTLFDYQGRHYFKGCYIEGSIDFIFGHGQSTYKECELFVKAQPGYLSGSITAQNRDDAQDSGGFVFVGCKITGTGEVFLGRAWGSHARVLFLYTYMSSIIAPQGWSDWGISSRQRIGGTIGGCRYHGGEAFVVEVWGACDAQAPDVGYLARRRRLCRGGPTRTRAKEEGLGAMYGLEPMEWTACVAKGRAKGQGLRAETDARAKAKARHTAMVALGHVHVCSPWQGPSPGQGYRPS